jgi:hypothetical protein
LRKNLWIFCAIAAVLSAIAFIDGILVVATFFAVIPMLVLAFARDALFVGLTLLIVDVLSPRRQSLHKGAIALAMAGLLFTLAGAATEFNRPLEREVQTVKKEDHDLSETLTETRNIAIQFITNGRPRSKHELATRVPDGIRQQDKDAKPDAVPPPARKQYCERLCLHLLFNGLADSVLVSSVPGAEGVLTPDLAEIGMRFHLGRQGGCRKPDIKTDDTVGPPYRLFEREEEEGFASEISTRMIKDGCVIGEPARLSEARIIVQENAEVLPETHVPSRISSARNIVHLIFAPERAARLSIYRVRHGSIEEVFRQTEVEGLRGEDFGFNAWSATVYDRDTNGSCWSPLSGFMQRFSTPFVAKLRKPTVGLSANHHPRGGSRPMALGLSGTSE